ATAQAQHPIDRFLTSKLESKVVLDPNDGIDGPQDLDFNRLPGRERELWVINREGDEAGGSIVILYDAGKSTEWSEYRRDSHSDHFMVNPTAIAMGANGNFANVAELLNTIGHADVIFMGPTLWTTDTSIFARENQNDWEHGQLLGSHSDMLHESPFSMGIAADTGNVYWVFDGHHGNIYRYDFKTPHGYGEDDHSDGIVYQYDVSVERTEDLPSHMVLDEATGWLYVVDNGNSRIFRMQTRSGERGDDLFDENEPLAEYAQMNDIIVQVFETGSPRLSGIDFIDGRLIVSNNSNGEIRVYNTTTSTPTYLGSIATNDDGIRGVKFGPDSAIWYVNYDENTVVRLAAGELLAVGEEGVSIRNTIYPSPARSMVNVEAAAGVQEIRVVNSLGTVVQTILQPESRIQIDVKALPNGVYYCQFVSGEGVRYERFVVSR
ncbi:MAG TPA: T9SS type A sorting domain-containing protein, partial [Candidatus Kapabacteria bacterium]|nr:T9SS type A sorting domain-containing protein [Candidatus Kapabacteria bacterium]